MIHSSLVGHQVCFQRLAIVNTAAMNTSVQVFLLYPVLFLFFGYVPGAVSQRCMVVLSLVL
jgi:hypothetical protein